MPNCVEISPKRGRDMFFPFFKMVVNFRNLKKIKGGNGWSNCITVPISSKSLEPWPRYRDFSIFQNGNRRYLGISKFEIVNCRNGQQGRTASMCQISSKSLEPRLRYGVFQMAAAAVLDFRNIELLTVGRVTRPA